VIEEKDKRVNCNQALHKDFLLISKTILVRLVKQDFDYITPNQEVRADLDNRMVKEQCK